MKENKIRWDWNSSANNQELQIELEQALSDNWEGILENEYKHIRIQRVINAIADVMYRRRLVQSDETYQQHRCKLDEICKHFEPITRNVKGGYQPICGLRNHGEPPKNE